MPVQSDGPTRRPTLALRTVGNDFETDDGHTGHSTPLPALTPVQQMVSSGTGAFLTALFMTPLDVVKIRLQSQVKPITSGQCFLYCNGLMDHICRCTNGGKGPMATMIDPWYKKPSHFNGTFDAMFKIAKNEGITKLWSGLPPTLLMAVPATVLYYTCYDQLKEWMGFQSGKSSLLIPMACGGLARVFAVTVISPLELVRTKMQSRPLTYNELVSCIRTAVHEEGLLSLWRGLGPTLLRDAPFSMILWLSYEYMKARVCLKYHTQEPTFLASFLSGAVSGTEHVGTCGYAGSKLWGQACPHNCIAAVITNPFDVVKTHRQIELGESMFNKGAKYQTSSTWRIMHRLYAERGIKGLFAGISPRIAKVSPACAMMISTYEASKAFFHKRNEGL